MVSSIVHSRCSCIVLRVFKLDIFHYVLYDSTNLFQVWQCLCYIDQMLNMFNHQDILALVAFYKCKLALRVMATSSSSVENMAMETPKGASSATTHVASQYMGASSATTQGSYLK